MKADLFNTSLAALKRRQPFHPFTVVLVNGDRFEVDHPDALLARHGKGVIVGPNGVLAIFDHEGVAEIIDDLKSAISP